ncbi:GerAB/ArcD/ProY family transporter [Paenibacillus sedimenti]|uniref:Endospore germination permease n=1 Tax=Paenibacillus sedimenti TaxID=2770274 RepID=A0A926KVB4_9BACL|nr:endospore germination permease [Paenibacillus sedimenti]MBD0382868.1 endospore germination permease [Paenibacillus sedimenti]
MQDNGNIEPVQLRKLVVLFMLGRAILIVPGILASESKQDAWISSAGGLLIGLCFVLLYRKLGELYPGVTLAEYAQKFLGSWVGKAVAFLFFVYAFLLGSMIVRSLGVFMASTMMPETPIEWIMGMFLFAAAIGVRNGLENMGRTADIFFLLAMPLFILFVVSVIPQIELDNLQPVLGKGIRPVLRGVYQQLGFPYMSLFLFLMILPFVNKNHEAGKAFAQGTLIGGSCLLIVTALCILVMGSDGTANELYPGYELARTIEIDIFQHVEAIMALIWFISIYFQEVVCCYAAVLILAQTFNLTDQRPLVFPVAFMLLPSALIIAPNVSILIEFTVKTWTAFSLTFGLFIPFILLVAAFVRRRYNRQTSG